MKLTELALRLKALGYPTAYSHFTTEQLPPFICYFVENGDTFSADNTVLSESTYVDIELYVVDKDLVAEKKVKEMLKENKLPWSYDEIFIDSEGVFKCTFSITLIN